MKDVEVLIDLGLDVNMSGTVSTDLVGLINCKAIHRCSIQT